jgi:methionyl aminopeptidase
MINLGTKDCKVLKDGWTVITRDKKWSAQFEHTILVTETGHEVLTLRNEEII